MKNIFILLQWLFCCLDHITPYTDQHYILPNDWPFEEVHLVPEKVQQEVEGTPVDRINGKAPDNVESDRPNVKQEPTQAAQSKKEFAKGAMADIVNADAEAAFIPCKVSKDNRELKKDDGGGDVKRRSLDATVLRWEHKEGIDPRDSEGAGCGAPVCAIIDARPKRFASLCNLTRHLNNFERTKQFLQVQKGDCADAIEGNGREWTWGNPPKDDCAECAKTKGCNSKVCVAVAKKARTYANVCEAMKRLHDQKDVVLILFALGDCQTLLSRENCLHTEWFDIDEPCTLGDVESAAQNLAAAANYRKTGRFRMCPRVRQVGDPQFQTIDGGDIPKEQVIEKDLKNQRLVCKNKDQVQKPGPPNYWYSNETMCRDYKIRHCCQCLYGCNPNNGTEDLDIEMPPVKHLFEECDWRPFVSNESPAPDTWDGEDRASAIVYGTGEHVCGASIFDAMFIDTRRRDDDVPCDETGENISKNTPWYGFLCLNKNNKGFGLLCSDYKVRYCCLKHKPAEWGDWAEWTGCSASCGGGTQTRDRVCVMKEGNKETCFGNWIDKAPDGQEKFMDLRKQVVKCNEIGCPEDAVFTEWRPWDPCTLTCGQARRRRRRGCDSARNGGKECPVEKDKYEEWADCKIPSCPDPMWTKWSEWGQCSLSCGLGKKRRDRKCEDTVTKQPLEPGMDCLGGGVQMADDCKMGDCPIDGQWTSWLNWGECNVLCGDHGSQTRRRYCAQPLPQFGGKTCQGDDEEDRKCQGLTPCPQHCEWSLWGSFSPCSVTCGFLGDGMQTRGRHISVHAEFGGRQCMGKDVENRVCPHEKMKDVKEQVADGTKPITFCPVDCVWADWQAWSPCPACTGDLSGISSAELPGIEQTRTRVVKFAAKYHGKACNTSSETENQKGKCTDAVVKACPEERGSYYVGQWTDWGRCVGPCNAKDAKMSRSRECLGGPEGTGGKGCSDALTQEEICPAFCPPEGWSEWDNWSNCPVTCGAANRARRRFCRDDNKDKNRGDLGNSTCRGIGRETQRCDMGMCGSKATPEFEGGGRDPISNYLDMTKAKEEAGRANNGSSAGTSVAPAGGGTNAAQPGQEAKWDNPANNATPGTSAAAPAAPAAPATGGGDPGANGKGAPQNQRVVHEGRIGHRIDYGINSNGHDKVEGERREKGSLQQSLFGRLRKS